jgi:chromosome segregation ATPase
MKVDMMNMPKNMSESYRVVMQLRDANKKKDNRIAELELWKKNACERMRGLSDSIDGYVEKIALAAHYIEQQEKRIAELEGALDKLIDQASMCDSWECFPSDWLDEAYESLSKGGAN